MHFLKLSNKNMQHLELVPIFMQKNKSGATHSFFKNILFFFSKSDYNFVTIPFNVFIKIFNFFFFFCLCFKTKIFVYFLDFTFF